MNDYIGKKRSGGMVILFSILTCGIYYLYWFYTVMDDINKASDKEYINPVLYLLGSLFIPCFIWFAMYKIDKNLGRLAQENGTYYKENFILWLLLSFVCIGFFVECVQIAGALNELWDKRSTGANVF